MALTVKLERLMGVDVHVEDEMNLDDMVPVRFSSLLINLLFLDLFELLFH